MTEDFQVIPQSQVYYFEETSFYSRLGKEQGKNSCSVIEDKDHLSFQKSHDAKRKFTGIYVTQDVDYVADEASNPNERNLAILTKTPETINTDLQCVLNSLSLKSNSSETYLQ